MNHTLLSSPLQSFTDFRFRNALDKYFGGIDTYYAPYIKMKGKIEIMPVYQRDLIPEHNTVKHLIPQIMTNKIEEFLYVIDYVKELGYDEVNWNLGCPYPMVVNRSLGSGLICQPEKIGEILEEIHAKRDIKISMKMRMGYENPTEILDVFPILERYPIKNIAIHARIGKQLYKGGVDLDAFQTCLNTSKQKIYYNGDITSVEGFKEMSKRFPSIDHWMIGRGLIMDPFLPSMIKNDTTTYPKNRIEVFKAFHDDLFHQYEEFLSGSTNVIRKMYHFWEYFSATFYDTKKGLKLMKKAKTIQDYHEGVKLILDNEYEYVSIK